MIKSFIARNIYEPLYANIYKGDNRVKLFHHYKKAQWNGMDYNKNVQRHQLFLLIKYASENIPYYRDIVQKNNIAFSEETIFEDIRKFPVLTKDIIRSEFNHMHKMIPGAKAYYNTSGGSTGEPVKLIQDKVYQSASNAMTRLQYEWAKYSLGDSQIKLWGSVKDILNEKEKMTNRFANWMKSVHILNAFSLDDETMRKYVNSINKRRPVFILSYVQSIYELAQFIEKNGLKIHSPKSIMTSAGTLTPMHRQKIEKVFQCPVFNRYGSREVGNIASECEQHEGLHVSMFTHYIEILNDRLEPCKEGEMGEVYVTLLFNYTMPLIRYKIGDLAVYTEKPCSCNRGIPLIKNIVGRTNSMIRTNKGVFDSAAISALLFFYEDETPFQSFSKYQFIQESKTDITFKVIVTDKDLWTKERAVIHEKFIKVLGPDVKIDIMEVEKILPLKSGKYAFIINNMKDTK